MARKEWRSLLGAIEGLPPGIPSEHVAVLAGWFERHLAPVLEAEDGPPPGDSGAPSLVTTPGLAALSFVDVRERMETLGASSRLRAHEKALLCAWVWSLGGDRNFCSNDAQKLYGDQGAHLNSHHFNQQSLPAEAPDAELSSMIRLGRGRYRLTTRGREEGRRLADQHLFSVDGAFPGSP